MNAERTERIARPAAARRARNGCGQHKLPPGSVLMIGCLALLPLPAAAQITSASGVNVADYSAVPVFLSLDGGSAVQGAIFLFNMARDQELFKEAYTDFHDLDEDGRVDTTYNNNIEYYGYFDPQKCYDYDEGNDYFTPLSFSARDGLGEYTYDCGGTATTWSGNFLNWASTVRMDVVRKVLYGGKRSTDTGTQTILEGARTSRGRHAFAKVADVGTNLLFRLTPLTSWGLVSANQRILSTCRYTPQPFNSWSHLSNVPPALRIGYGNLLFWATLTAGKQCIFGTRAGTNRNNPDRGNYAQPFALPEAPVPNTTTSHNFVVYHNGIIPFPTRFTTQQRRIPLAGDSEMVLRTEVCLPALINADNKENCRQYPDGNFKPAGLLQRYGESGTQAAFGLMGGGYAFNTSYAFLRRAVRAGLENEINITTDGTFRSLESTPPPRTNEGDFIAVLDNTVLYGAHFTTTGIGNFFSQANVGRLSSFPSGACVFESTHLSSIQPTSNTQSVCKSWGNPLSEMVYEGIAYLAGVGNGYTSLGQEADELGLSPHLNALPYTDNADLLPAGTDAELACAPVNQLIISSGISTYDTDTFPTRSLAGNGILFENLIAAATDTIGASELRSGSEYFIGSNGTTTDFICSPKRISNLSDVHGICPDAPSQFGSFLAAGAAYYAHVNDLHPARNGVQTINTLAIDLRPVTPLIEVPGGALGTPTAVRIIPSQLNNSAVGLTFPTSLASSNDRCDPMPRGAHSNGQPLDGAGQLVTFRLLGDFHRQDPDRDGSTNIYQSRYLVTWEDAVAGADFDFDVGGIVQYRLDTGTAPMTIEVSTEFNLIDGGGSRATLFGFSIQGTTQDGVHFYSGARGGAGTDYCTDPAERLALYNNPYNTDPDNPVIPSCGYPFPASGATRENDQSGGTPDNPDDLLICSPNGGGAPAPYDRPDSPGQVSYTFTVSNNALDEVLQTPLYYAAKWGGFADQNNNDEPDLPEEWDTVDLLGEARSDGIPDNYYPVTNPANLERSLERAFVQGGIAQRTASGTAAAVVANEREGTGALFQALFEPLREDADSNSATWIGSMHALFVDPAGLFREDNNRNGRLDGYDVDAVVELFYDAAEGSTRVRRFSSGDSASFVPVANDIVELEELQPIWNAREQLSALTSPGRQRGYTGENISAGSRYVFTWLDLDGNQEVDQATEIIDFVPASFSAADRYARLDVVSSPDAATLINFIRGAGGPPNVRTQAVDYDGDGSVDNMRLGDIVNSSPISVGIPAEAYDLLANDFTYRVFREDNVDRRQVIYVGANDGMLHAFNGGFYDAQNNEFRTSPSGGSALAHPLGGELWAYVPRAVLPYLRFLADPDYPHVYYVDGSARVFDAKVFPVSSEHPGGWGTLLVIGLRFGSGSDTRRVEIDIDGDGLGAADANCPVFVVNQANCDDREYKSSYVVLDVTNPEAPPTLIAELSPEGLNFAVSRPAVVPFENTNQWYLVFGTGPSTQSTGSTADAPLLFVYSLGDLVDSAPFNILPFEISLPSGVTGQFIGGFVVADYDLDLDAEAIFFGTVGNTDSDAGGLYRFNVDNEPNPSFWVSADILLATDQPIFAEPTIAVDEEGNRWVYVGTGRLLAEADRDSTTLQSLYGVIDTTRLGRGVPTVQVDVNGLLDVSGATSLTDGRVRVPSLTGSPPLDADGLIALTALREEVQTRGGWRRDYQPGSNVSPSQRSFNPSSLLGEVLFNSAFTPPGASTSGVSECGGSPEIGQSTLIGVDFRSGVPHTVGVFGREPCSLSVCSDEVEEAVGEIDLGSGLASVPSLHIGEPGQDVPGRITVVVQQSTGEVQAIEALGAAVPDSREVNWREYFEE